MQFRPKAIAGTLMLTALNASVAQAEQVQIPFNGLTLNGNLELAEDKTLADGVLLLLHGTLAHNEMEIIATLQELIVDAGVSTLAINLSYSIDNRESARYDCAVPARHTMQDAVAEMEAWQNWLDGQGAGDRWVMGHSRGGNQTSQYTLAHQDKVKGQILLAPATWDYKYTIDGYQKRYGTSVTDLLDKAKTLAPDTMMDGVSVVYCEKSGATAGAMLSYYGNYPNYDTPHVLAQTETPTLVIAGSKDTVVDDLPQKMEGMNKENVELVVIDDADHFFRDLFADEVAEYAVDFIESL